MSTVGRPWYPVRRQDGALPCGSTLFLASPDLASDGLRQIEMARQAQSTGVPGGGKGKHRPEGIYIFPVTRGSEWGKEKIKRKKEKKKWGSVNLRPGTNSGSTAGLSLDLTRHLVVISSYRDQRINRELIESFDQPVQKLANPTGTCAANSSRGLAGEI